MDFERSIILEIRDRATRSLRGINRTIKRMRDNFNGINRSTQQGQRATARWERAVQALGRAYRRARDIASNFARVAVQGAKRATQAVIAIGTAAVGGAARVGFNLATENRQAEQVGLDVNQLRSLSLFLSRATQGALSLSEVPEVLRDLQERQEEARVELDRQRGDNPGLSFNDATGTAIEGLRDLGITEADLSATSSEFFQTFISAIRNSPDAAFIGRELASNVGDAFKLLANRTQEELEQIQKEIQETLNTVSDQDVQNAKDFASAFRDFQTQIKIALEQVLLPLLPTITDGLNKAGEAVTRFKDSETFQLIADVTTALFTLVQTAFKPLAGVVEAASGAINTFIGAVEGLLERLGLINAQTADEKLQREIDRVTSVPGVRDGEASTALQGQGFNGIADAINQVGTQRAEQIVQDFVVRRAEQDRQNRASRDRNTAALETMAGQIGRLGTIGFNPDGSVSRPRSPALPTGAETVEAQ